MRAWPDGCDSVTRGGSLPATGRVSAADAAAPAAITTAATREGRPALRPARNRREE